MNTVIVSPKYQVVIPKDVRNVFETRPGMKLRVIPYKNQLVFIPVEPVENLRGALKGIDTTIRREGDRL